MGFSTTEEMIIYYRSIYSGISPIYSKAIQDTIYFSMSGFKHLVYKGKHRRTNAALRGRLVLIPLIIPVIKECKEEQEIRIRRERIDGKNVRVTYYALEAHVGKANALVRVVTRKVGEEGKHYFHSVMKH